MKVLFAVSDESVSQSIVKKYQQMYKEIITSKNVYYFNAIVKELQKDKTYDRVVISEDLEPFTNSNYETIDNLIFEKLDNISDEATTSQGEDISIILIATDRRSKSDNLLVKLFGIGVYSVLIGQDRNVNELCKLIRKPRSKKEAKQYYNIKSNDVEYKPENEGNVSETEIQSILTYFKRLGKNEERYVETFDKVASQYTDQQLRVITKFLPLNVRAVLEANSPKYQQLVSFGTQNVKKLNDYKASNKTKMKNNTTKAINNSGITISSISSTEKKLTKPVIIPSANKVKRVQQKNISEMQNNISKVESTASRPIQQKEQTKQIENVEEKVKKRGRPKKVIDVQEEQIEPAKKKRGRPRKTEKEEIAQIEEEKNEDVLMGFNDETQNSYEENGDNVILPNYVDDDDEDDEIVLPNFDDDEDEEEEAEKEETVLPSFDDEDDEEEAEKEETVLPSFDDDEEEAEEEETVLPSFDDDEDDEEEAEEEETVLPSFDDDDDDEEETGEEETVLPSFDDDDDDEEEAEEEETVLPSLDDDDDDDDDEAEEEETVLPSLDDDDDDEEEAEEEETVLPSLDDDEDDEEDDFIPFQEDSNLNLEQPKATSMSNMDNSYEEYQNKTDIENYNKQPSSIEGLLTNNQKIVAFVGTSKNGTSFLVNNIAEILSNKGIKTAILDLINNKNSYYIYTKNEEDLRKIAFNSIEKLVQGYAQGIKVNNNLDVYTSLPGQDDFEQEYQTILETLIKNYSLVILDCDFKSNYGYLNEAQEIYLVQSMDVLTIQPLTAYLRELKAKEILKQEKLKIIINKYTKVKGISEKAIIGGMAFYNDPAMAYMTELFNREMVPYCTIPFDSQVYAKYLEALINCKISINGYSKEFTNTIQKLASMVYPLIGTRKIG